MNPHTLRLAALSSIACMVGAVEGCRRQVASVPPELRPGRDVCAECGMLIADDRFAGALRALDAERGFLLFDDIDCMLSYERAHAVPDGTGACFVRDYQDRTWIERDGAKFLCADPERLKTPMASGIVAFWSAQCAHAAHERYGGVVANAHEVRDRSARRSSLGDAAGELTARGIAPERE